jgi:DNA-binding ferritin-like protein
MIAGLSDLHPRLGDLYKQMRALADLNAERVREYALPLVAPHVAKGVAK